MNIGVRAHDYPRQPVPQLLDTIAQDGWQGIQLAFHKVADDISTPAGIPPAVAEETRQALCRTRLQLTVLGVYIEPSLAEESARSAQAAEFIKGITLAKDLGAVCIGTETTNMAKQPGVPRSTALAQLRRTLEEVLPHAQEKGVVVAIEPVYNHALATPALTAQLLRDMASPWLAVIFDPVNLLDGDLLAAGHRIHTDLWQRCMEAFGDRIAAVHIKGVTLSPQGQPVGRVPLTQSLVDYTGVFAALRQLPGMPPVLREEAERTTAAADIELLRRLMQ